MSKNETGLVAAVSHQICPEIDPKQFLATVQDMCCKSVKGGVSTEEFAAFLMTCQKYNLNPIMKEIYPFRDRRGGFQCVVGIDGWLKTAHVHPQFDGLDVDDDPEKGSCTVTIHRKDMSHPIRVTEWLSECAMDSQPWKDRPIRMLRHKSTIQAIRYAFNLSGIIDPEEAHQIVPNDTEATVVTEPPSQSVSRIEVWCHDNGITMNEVRDCAEDLYGRVLIALNATELAAVQELLIAERDGVGPDNLPPADVVVTEIDEADKHEPASVSTTAAQPVDNEEFPF